MGREVTTSAKQFLSVFLQSRPRLCPPALSRWWIMLIRGQHILSYDWRRKWFSFLEKTWGVSALKFPFFFLDVVALISRKSIVFRYLVGWWGKTFCFCSILEGFERKMSVLFLCFSAQPVTSRNHQYTLLSILDIQHCQNEWVLLVVASEVILFFQINPFNRESNSIDIVHWVWPWWLCDNLL